MDLEKKLYDLELVLREHMLNENLSKKREAKIQEKKERTKRLSLIENDIGQQQSALEFSSKIYFI